MCGRYTLTPHIEEILEHYALEEELASYQPRYNIAPSQDVPVVRMSDTPPERTLSLMHWGLIPHWAKDEKVGYRMINAVGETVSQKPSYRTPFKKHRCLIPASGFYEWQKINETIKQPYYIHLKHDKIFSFAGLWDHWSGRNGIDSCTIITTEPNEVVKPIHNRMPVIIDPGDYDLWLNPDTPQDTLQSLLAPYTAKAMEAYPISTRVNNPKHTGPECISRL